MTYIADPSNPAVPLDSDDATGGAAEFRALKGYLQGLISGGSSFDSYAWQGFRNRFINPRPQFWDHGTVLASGTGKRFLAVGWGANSVGSTYNYSQQQFTTGQPDVPNNPRYFVRIGVTSVAGAANLAVFQQLLEDVRTFAGQTCTLSFWAKADGIKQVAIELAQNFGSGGSPSTFITGIGVQKITLTADWQFFQCVIDVPSMSGKTIGTNDDSSVQVNFWLDAGSNFNARTDTLGQQSGNFDFCEFQIEPGGSATPLEIRPENVERDLCNRQWVLLGAAGSTFLTTGGMYTGAIGQISLPFEMRANPTIIGGPLTLFAQAQNAAVTTSVSQNRYVVLSTAVGAYTTQPAYLAGPAGGIKGLQAYL